EAPSHRRNKTGAIRKDNPAAGQPRDANRAADFGEAFKALRRAKCGLRRRVEDGPKKKIIRTGARSRSRSFQGVARHADKETFRFVAVPDKSPGFRQRKTTLAEMDAAGAFRKSDVQPVVHENVRGGSVARLVFRGPM